MKSHDNNNVICATFFSKFYDILQKARISSYMDWGQSVFNVCDKIFWRFQNKPK